MDTVAVVMALAILGALVFAGGAGFIATVLWSPWGRRIRTRYEMKKLQVEFESLHRQIRELEEQQSSDCVRLMMSGRFDGLASIIEEQVYNRERRIDELKQQEMGVVCQLSLLRWATRQEP